MSKHGKITVSGQSHRYRCCQSHDRADISHAVVSHGRPVRHRWDCRSIQLLKIQRYMLLSRAKKPLSGLRGAGVVWNGHPMYREAHRSVTLDLYKKQRGSVQENRPASLVTQREADEKTLTVRPYGLIGACHGWAQQAGLLALEHLHA